MIVKLQRPMAPADAPWMVYDQRRSINEFIAVNELPSRVTAMMGADFKLYIHALRDGDGRLIFGKRAEAQEW